MYMYMLLRVTFLVSHMYMYMLLRVTFLVSHMYMYMLLRVTFLVSHMYMYKIICIFVYALLVVDILSTLLGSADVYFNPLDNDKISMYTCTCSMYNIVYMYI